MNDTTSIYLKPADTHNLKEKVLINGKEPELLQAAASTLSCDATGGGQASRSSLSGLSHAFSHFSPLRCLGNQLATQWASGDKNHGAQKLGRGSSL